MKREKTWLSLIIINVYILLCFTACKKYDESNLWFTNPKKIAFIDGHMTHYIVNGIDSIDYLDNFFYNDIFNNPYSHKFSDLDIWSKSEYKGYYKITIYKPVDYAYPNSIISDVGYKYSKDGKTIRLSGTKSILNNFRKNIFINDAIAWEIIYLKRKDNKRKMKGEYNGNTYEIQFN